MRLRADRGASAAAIVAAYGVPVPARYARFLQTGEHRRYRRLQLDEGYLRGTFLLDFAAPALLDLQKLGAEQGIASLMWDDGATARWREAYPDWVPLSTLTDPELYAPDADESYVVESFLVVNVCDPACPVALWDPDHDRLHPLADSLDDFLGGVPTQANCPFLPQFHLE